MLPLNKPGRKITIRALVTLIPLSILFLLFPINLWSGSQTVRIPLTIDYSLMRSLFIEQAYTKPGGRAVPVDMNEGCNKIELWNPDVGPETTLLKLGSNIRISMGFPVAKTCFKVSEWEGHIDVLQRIVLDPQSMRLKLDAFDFRALTPEGKRTSFNQPVNTFLTTYLTPFLSQVGVDLSVPLKDLKSLLPLFFSSQEQPRIQSWLGTLRPSQIKIGPEGISLDILMDVDVQPKPKEPTGVRPESVIDNMVKSWEGLDAFAINQIEVLFGQLLTEEEKQNILETLLDMRYDFINSLSEGTLDPALLGNQFVSAWQSLSPIMRKYLSGQTNRSPLNFLTFLTVSDALLALNKIGPDAVMIPSRDGLLRLAKLLGVKQVEPSLDYSYAVRPDLRTFFGFGNPLDETGPAFNGFEMDLLDKPTQGMNLNHMFSFLKTWPSLAFAAETPLFSKEILPWVMPKGDISLYLNRIKLALNQGANEVLSKKRLDTKYHFLFQQMVLATAWQESCWRQFTGTESKVSCLVSYNQSSVGLMQINERVWRGIYRPESLRWNSLYNIRAGCEILEEYLRRYALKKPESKTMNADTLAQTLYAMYNGGPGQFKKFLLRSKTNKLFKSDKLFWEKYSWIKSNQLDKLRICLGR